MNTPFELVVKAAGNQRRLAALVGVTPQALTGWRRKIPGERVLEIERVTGVSRCEIRPDLYPPSDYAA